MRLPDNIETLKYMSVFNVEKTRKCSKSSGEMVKIAKLLGYAPEVINKIVQQWRAIHLSDWMEKNNTLGFWSEIWKFRDAAVPYTTKLAEHTQAFLGKPGSTEPQLAIS